MRPRWALALLLASSRAHAHPLSFGLLELRERGGGRVAVTWRVSGGDPRALASEPALPPWCAAVAPPTSEPIADGVARRSVVDCGARGLAGAEVSVAGLAGTGVQAVVRHVREGGAAAEGALDDARAAWTVPADPGAGGVFARYVALGVEHIATGWDHLAFLLGLALVVEGRRALALAVTSFTAGHSATLALAALGLARAPARAVEAAVAWSVVVVAREALGRRGDLARRAPWAVALLFGLLHGFGFAGALASAGLPRGAAVPALLAFNVGVELGQVALVALGLAAAAAWARAGLPTSPARRALAYAAGVAGMYWCVTRVAAFWDA